jgi:hypothetical protein
MPKEKKVAFKDGGPGSGIGNFLRSIDKEAILNAGSVVTNIASGNWLGAVGAVKNLIEKDPDITPAQQKEAGIQINLAYADIQDARRMYTETDHKAADEIAESVIKKNLPIIGILIGVNIASVIFLKDKGELIAIISNFIGIAIGQLFNERQQVISFFFGSSQGSKDKDNRM